MMVDTTAYLSKNVRVCDYLSATDVDKTAYIGHIRYLY